MLVFLLLILLEIISVVFCALAIRRLYIYINRYRFNESVYTLLFGVLRLRYFVWIYIFTVSLFVIMGLILGVAFLSV